MKYGIWYFGEPRKNLRPAWCSQNYKRLEFDLREDAVNECKRWEGYGDPYSGLYEVRLLPEEPEVGKASNPKDAIGDKKVPLWLCSAIAKAEWALAQFAGLVKYGAWNWRKAGVRTSVYLSAMQRHLDAFTNGEEIDPVDGTHHLGNIMACAAIILDAKAAGKLTDDRPPIVDIRATYARVEQQMAVLREKYADQHPHHFTSADP